MKHLLQDVVYALAHATGKTGRFTLVERWRNNERLLAPQEHPLKVTSIRLSLVTNAHILLADNQVSCHRHGLCDASESSLLLNVEFECLVNQLMQIRFI